MRSGRTAAVVGGLTVLLAAVVLLLVAPGPVGLHGSAPLAQAVALRGLVAVGLAALGVLLVLLPWRRTLAPLAAVLLLGALVQVGVLAVRGAHVGGTEPWPRADRPRGAVVVLVLNTQDSIDPDALADLLLRRDVDVAVLPETLGATAEAAASLAEDEGTAFQVLADDALSPVGATAVLVHPGLGPYTIVARHPGDHATFTVAGDGGGPVVTAVHPYPPLPGGMPRWRSTTQAAVDLCDSPGAIVAGDLNATLDHPALADLGRCVDAATAAGVGAMGTWPVTLPPLLAAPIDHVLADGDVWQVERAQVIEPPDGTDHRALEVVLAPRVAAQGRAGR